MLYKNISKCKINALIKQKHQFHKPTSCQRSNLHFHSACLLIFLSSDQCENQTEFSHSAVKFNWSLTYIHTYIKKMDKIVGYLQLFQYFEAFDLYWCVHYIYKVKKRKLRSWEDEQHCESCTGCDSLCDLIYSSAHKYEHVGSVNMKYQC